MLDVNIDLSSRGPRKITSSELADVDILVTIRSPTEDLRVGVHPDTVREWTVPDPADADLSTILDIRDEISDRVVALFDEIEAELAVVP